MPTEPTAPATATLRQRVLRFVRVAPCTLDQIAAQFPGESAVQTARNLTSLGLLTYTKPNRRAKGLFSVPSRGDDLAKVWHAPKRRTTRTTRSAP